MGKPLASSKNGGGKTSAVSSVSSLSLRLLPLDYAYRFKSLVGRTRHVLECVQRNRARLRTRAVLAGAEHGLYGSDCCYHPGRGYKRDCVASSGVTPKPANEGHLKTGQWEEAWDYVVLPCSLLWRQVYFRTPTPRTAFEYMTMMEKAVEHGGNGGAISQQFAPVLDGSV